MQKGPLKETNQGHCEYVACTVTTQLLGRYTGLSVLSQFCQLSFPRKNCQAQLLQQHGHKVLKVNNGKFEQLFMLMC